jgi:uncharacterized membrane protein
LSRIGRPLVTAVASALAPDHRGIASWLDNQAFLSILDVVAVLALLWLLGWMATRVLGQRLIDLFERVVGLVPFVDKIYQATKRVLTVAGTAPDSDRRVVLIDFPSPDMKTIGLVTRILKDRETGEALAAVYVPTSPDPTSGYIEIVPVRNVTFTDWTFDQAMSFVVRGGSSAPDTIAYSGRRGEASRLTGDPSQAVSGTGRT